MIYIIDPRRIIRFQPRFFLAYSKLYSWEENLKENLNYKIQITFLNSAWKEEYETWSFIRRSQLPNSILCKGVNNNNAEQFLIQSSKFNPVPKLRFLPIPSFPTPIKSIGSREKAISKDNYDAIEGMVRTVRFKLGRGKEKNNNFCSPPSRLTIILLEENGTMTTRNPGQVVSIRAKGLSRSRDRARFTQADSVTGITRGRVTQNRGRSSLSLAQPCEMNRFFESSSPQLFFLHPCQV